MPGLREFIDKESHFINKAAVFLINLVFPNNLMETERVLNFYDITRTREIILLFLLIQKTKINLQS